MPLGDLIDSGARSTRRVPWLVTAGPHATMRAATVQKLILW
jgi:hypothetical protein